MPAPVPSLHPPSIRPCRRTPRPLLAFALLPLLAACASFSPQRAGDEAREHAAEAIGPAAGIDATAHRDHLLAAPLSQDSAVALAMAYNPRLRMTWSRLGVGAAEAFEASRLANPHLSFSRLSGEEGVQRTLSLGLGLADLLLLPQRSRLARRDFEALRLEVAARAVDVARDTEAAWYRHVAAEQAATLKAAIAEAAGASAELAERFHAAGNISRLQLLRERAAAAEAQVAATEARAEAIASRRELNALMGLGGEDARRWQTPEQLPLPVMQEPALEALLAQADQARLDLAAARLQVGILSDGQRLERGWRWLGGIELDYEWEREPDGSRMRGPGLKLELPLFQQGQARVLRADARLARAQAELAERELAVELGVREAHARVEALREIVATYAAGIVPDRAEAVERELERYNFMLIGAFELLEAKQAEYRAYEGWIHAVRDYWLARTELAHAAGVRLPGATPADGQTPDLRPILTPGEDAEEHEHHHHHGSLDAPGSPHAAGGGMQDRTPQPASRIPSGHAGHGPGAVVHARSPCRRGESPDRGSARRPRCASHAAVAASAAPTVALPSFLPHGGIA